MHCGLGSGQSLLISDLLAAFGKDSRYGSRKGEHRHSEPEGKLQADITTGEMAL
jgi:hypothetical protein